MAFRAGRVRLPRVRLRAHIATWFVALITGAGIVLIGYGYRATSRLLLAAGDEDFLSVAERTADRVRDLLAPARFLAELLARHPLMKTAALGARLEALPLLTTALATHPEISAVYVGFTSGDFFLVRSLSEAVRQNLHAPPAAAFLVQSVAAADRPAPGRYLYLDARLGTVRDDSRPDYRFDARTRAWYRQAAASATLVRSDPYIFFTTRELGTTLAHRSADGGAVVGVDITLQALSRHLAQSRVTPSARLALVDGHGVVIAYPDPARLFRPGPGGELNPTRLTDLEDPALGPLLAAAGEAARTHVTLSLPGRAWIGARRAIETSAGDPLTLLLAAPRDELVAEARGLAEWQLVIGLGVLGVTLGLVWLSARSLSRPIEMLADSVDRMGRGDLETTLPEIWNPLEVSALRDVTDRMRRTLRGHIEERAARLAEEQRRARELDIARQIQQSMLPVAPTEPLGGEFAIAATLQPAREVGGDLYDFFLLDGRRLVLAIADVADKGMPAALLMARVTGLLRAIGRGDIGPDEILRELDARLSQGNDICMFVTMACAVLDGESGELRYASAGHERPLLRRAGGATAVLVLEGGPALGLGMGGAYPVWVGHLAPGDALVLCTDGVTEAFDTAGVAFGLERFRDVVADASADALATLPARLMAAVERFSQDGAPRDDLALLAVEHRPPEVAVDVRGDPTWRLAVTTEPSAVARALRSVDAILRARAVPSSTVQDCVLALEELLANVLMHAYGGQPGPDARIEIRLRAEEIAIRLEDTGPPFNPLEAPAPDLEAPLAERPVGGLGLFLVKHLVERWEYAREGPRNVVTFYHRRPDEAPAALEGVPLAAALYEGREGETMELQIQVRDSGATQRTVTLKGRLDSLTVPKLEAELTPILDAPAVTALLFRLDGLEYVSSAGIRCFVRARRAIEGRGGRVAIVNPQPAVRKVFEIVKALPVDQVFASEAELDAYLDAMQRRVRGH